MRRFVRHLSVAPNTARQPRELPEVGTLADCSRKGFSGSHLQQCDELARPPPLDGARGVLS